MKARIQQVRSTLLSTGDGHSLTAGPGVRDRAAVASTRARKDDTNQRLHSVPWPTLLLRPSHVCPGSWWTIDRGTCRFARCSILFSWRNLRIDSCLRPLCVLVLAKMVRDAESVMIPRSLGGRTVSEHDSLDAVHG